MTRAHSKSEYKRRVAMGDTTVLPPKSRFASWAVYDHPKDYPDCYVARLFLDEVPTDQVVTGKTLESVRALLPPGRTRIPRFDLDDECIVEVWL